MPHSNLFIYLFKYIIILLYILLNSTPTGNNAIKLDVRDAVSTYKKTPQIETDDNHSDNDYGQ